MKMQQEGLLNPQRIDSLRQIYQPIADEISNCKEQYIRKYPDSDVSVYLLADLGGARAKVLLPLVAKGKDGADVFALSCHAGCFEGGRST